MSYKPKLEESVGHLPEKYLELKKSLVKDLDPDVLRKSWGEVLEALEKMTSESARLGPEGIPQVDFNDLQDLSSDRKDLIKRRGAVVIRNIVPKAEALEWKEWLKEYVKDNEVTGVPDDNKVFFQL